MNKTALITGGTSGIGLELAKLFAQDKYNLVLVARTQTDLIHIADKLEADYGIDVTTIAKDLFDIQNAFALYEEVKAKGISVDVLVNDAGHGAYGEFVDSDLQLQLQIIQLNISSLVVLTQLYLKDMVAKGEGKILNLSSVASKAPGPWQAVYHGTKAFVQSFTEAIRSEIKDRNKDITITALLPGATDTDFFNKANMNESKIVQDKSNLADAAQVAKDGYDALMSDKDMVVSGLKNKVQVAMTSLTPDQMAADKMKKQQEPVYKKK